MTVFGFLLSTQTPIIPSMLTIKSSTNGHVSSFGNKRKTSYAIELETCMIISANAQDWKWKPCI